jgi:hypothetical protein
MRIFVIVLAGLAFVGMMFAILGPFERYGPILDQPAVGMAYKIVCDEAKGHDYAVTVSTKEGEIAYAQSAENAESENIDAQNVEGAKATISALPDGTTVRVIDEESKRAGWGEILILEGDRAGQTTVINIRDQKYEEIEEPDGTASTLSGH